jgi:hypothetical protein
LIFHATTSVTVDSNLPVGNNFARITSPFGQFQADNYDAYGAYTGNFAEHWDVPVPSWQVGTVGTITLYAYTHGQGLGPSYGPGYFFNSRVFIDPEIEIDPAFAQAGKYSIEFSPGVLAAPGTPTLAITLTATNTVLVSWPSPSTGWALQQNSSLTTTNWVTPPEIVTDNGTNKFILVNPPADKRFYRLVRP